MGGLGLTLRRAREQAGLSLSGMAKRTGYSRSYLGNVETGIRQVTPDLIRAYERVLGDDLKRRQLLVGSIAALAATSTPDAATAIANDISGGRAELLAGMQTSHTTDKAIAAYVARDPASIACLAKWSRSGRAVLRVNATGILAKVRSPLVDNEAVTVLRGDGDVRELYLTAVIARVLNLPWDDAGDLARGGAPPSPEAVPALSAELGNPADAGARWCSALLLARARQDDPTAVTDALITALRTEPSGEVLRTIGSALAGIDPLKM
jgi:transcriptional regulator with XRE-family HTH domain